MSSHSTAADDTYKSTFTLQTLFNFLSDIPWAAYFLDLTLSDFSYEYPKTEVFKYCPRT